MDKTNIEDGTVVNITDDYNSSVSINVDDFLSDTSENPVQNKVIKAEIDTVEQNLTTHENDTAAHISTTAQSFSGVKTFSGTLIPDGATDITVAQARKIYAGTDDLIAGTSVLETGAIYLVYE